MTVSTIRTVAVSIVWGEAAAAIEHTEEAPFDLGLDFHLKAVHVNSISSPRDQARNVSSGDYHPDVCFDSVPHEVVLMRGGTHGNVDLFIR